MNLYTFLFSLITSLVFLIIFIKLNSNTTITNYETIMKIGNKLFFCLKVNQNSQQIEKDTKHKLDDSFKKHK